jgi:S1-C subfamily serine protease
LNLSDGLAKLKGLSQGGAQVVSVDPASPASKAGILAGDLIVSADNQDLPANNFEKILNKHGNSPLPVVILRNGQRVNFSVNIEIK